MNTLINIDVPDLQSAIEFYCAAFGLQHTRTLDADVAELSGAPSPIYLLQKNIDTHYARAAEGTRYYSRHWTPVHLDFVVDDLEQAAERALMAGAMCESDCVQWRGSKCMTFSDPFGHGFCLIEFSARTYSDAQD